MTEDPPSQTSRQSQGALGIINENWMSKMRVIQTNIKRRRGVYSGEALLKYPECSGRGGRKVRSGVVGSDEIILRKKRWSGRSSKYKSARPVPRDTDRGEVSY